MITQRDDARPRTRNSGGRANGDTLPPRRARGSRVRYIGGANQPDGADELSDENEAPVIGLHGAITAPVLYFDDAPVFGIGNGIGRITLSTMIQDEDGKGGLTTRRVVVAHLRGNALAFAGLREAINGMELMNAGPAEPEGPTN